MKKHKYPSTRKPGSGAKKKPEELKKVPVQVYLRQCDINFLGGKPAVIQDVVNYLNNKLKNNLENNN